MKNTLDELQELGFKDALEKNLQADYEKALQKKEFKELVDLLELSSKTLMKYTTHLEEASLEYEHCKNCSNLLACKNRVLGYAYLPFVVGKKLDFHYKACRYQIEKMNLQKEASYITCFSSQVDIEKARFEEIYKNDKSRFEAIEWIHDFIEKYQVNPKQKGLYLHGSFGCGKTFLITVLLHELALKKVHSVIVFWPEYLRELKTSFDSDFKEKFEAVRKTPILFIDDIGAEVTTPWGRDEVLGPILQYRMENHLPTFFTSNLNIDSLEEHLSISKNSVDEVKARRIRERIIQLADVICMKSKNLRS